MAEQLWKGRISKAGDSRVNDFNSSIRFDQRMIAQDIVGAAAHENRRFTRRDGADHVALNLEQRVVRQHVRHAPVVAHERRPQVADAGWA